MGANCSTSTHYHNNICATIVHVCKLHQYCLVAVQKVLRGAQSIWIHLSNCKNCPQQSLQLQWAHAPHSYVHFFFWKKGGLSEHQCFFDTQYFCLLSAANPLIQQSTIMLTLCTTISQFLCFSPFFISMLLLFSKFGETVRKCLLSSPECEGPKL